MANFIGLVFATLKNEGVDTSKMSTQEAIDKYNELKGGKSGTPAEERKMKEPKSEHIDHSVFDKAEKYYTSVEGRDERSIQAFRDVREKINEMANAGSSYNDIDTELTNDFSTLEYKTNKLMDKKEKTEQEKAEIISNRRKLEGMSFAISQLYKVWKK